MILNLQFLQCLASPNYLYELASKGYLDDPAFINYLDYLSYWREPKYAQFILYVQASVFKPCRMAFYDERLICPLATRGT